MAGRRLLKSVVPLRLRVLIRHLRHGDLLSPYVRPSFAQEGEDLLLARLFEYQTKGFYVDVGAHHPTRFSNTHLLHKKGWRGINIDPTPGGMTAFRRARPDDINLEIAVSSEDRMLILNIFDEPALNSFSEQVSSQRDQSRYSIQNTVEVIARPLREILNEHLPHDVEVIDLLTIDAEGHDLSVLRSNDWDRFRPRVVLVEVLGSTVEDLNAREEVVLLRQLGYRIYSKLFHTVVFVDSGVSMPPPPRP